MARQRMLNPGFFTDEKVVACSFAARLLFAGLWGEADRCGRLLDKPLALKMRLFPADAVDVEALLSELVAQGLVVRYEGAGRALLWLPNFLRHQRPHHKEMPSALPPPPMEAVKAPENTSSMGTKVGAGTNLGGHETGVSPSESESESESEQLHHVELDAAEAAQQPLLEVEKTLPGDVRDVWEHWKATMNHPRAVLDKPRKRLIEARLESYSVEDLQHAIDGCAANRAAKPEMRAYDGIGLILRDSEKVEMFMSMRPR